RGHQQLRPHEEPDVPGATRWGKVRTDHAGEETERSGGIPAQAELPADAGAVVAGGPAAAAPAAPVRDPEARRHVAPLRSAAGSRRCAEVVGGAEGAVDGPTRSASGHADRGPSALLRGVRGR